MRVIGNIGDTRSRGTILTVGVFDGVHLGHQHLLRAVVERARETDAGSAVVTFDPHPQSVTAPGTEPALLTAVGERVRLIRDLSVDVVGVLRFTRRISRMSAEQFIDLLLEHFRLIELWIGPDTAFGYRRQGTREVLSGIGERKGFSTRVVSPKFGDGGIISSTEIRKLLLKGNVHEAARLLGRPYSLVGEVVSGFERGRELGFPTANVSAPAHLLVPGDGIYAVRVYVGTRAYSGVLNVGVRPTFAEGASRTIEVHILEYAGNLYGQRLRLEFVERLRDEVRFSSVQQLVEQIRHDVNLARLVLQK